MAIRIVLGQDLPQDRRHRGVVEVTDVAELGVLPRETGHVWEHTFVSIKGSAYSRFRRALDTGNLTVVRAAAAELPTVNLDDALRICLLLRDADPRRYERAMIRWLGRLCLERPQLGLEELRGALAACERLPHEPDQAFAELRQLVWR